MGQSLRNPTIQRRRSGRACETRQYQLRKKMTKKKTLKPTKKQLDDATERAGELCTRNISKNKTQWMNELREKHPGYTYNEVYQAYRRSNPNDNHFSKSREPLYKLGQAKNTGEFVQVIGRLAIERENAVAEARDKITQTILEENICTVDENGRISTVNPGLLKIFEIRHEYEQPSRDPQDGKTDAEGTDEPTSDSDRALDDFIAGLRKAKDTSGQR